MNKRILVFLPFLLGILAGCASDKTTNPIINDPVEKIRPFNATSTDSTSNNRYLLGYWDVYIPENRESIELYPLRTTDLHLNAVRLLEVTPCQTCLTVENVTILPSGLLSAGFRLQHPFPGLDKYTGFDVRGILITGGNYGFEIPQKESISWYSNEIPMLVNYDGYTDLFNPTDFPEDLDVPPALKYIPGKKATGGFLNATLNPYISYQDWQPRRMFPSGAAETHEVLLRLPDGPIWFGYAVDVSWFPVDGEINDPVQDFAPEANSLEPYSLQIDVGKGIWNGIGSKSKFSIVVHDHQGIDTVNGMFLSAPDLSFNLSLADYFYIDQNTGLFQTMITNVNGLEQGHYPLLVEVYGSDDDPNLGTRYAYSVYDLFDAGTSNGWAVTWGNAGDDYAYGLDLDEQGNIYVAGVFQGTVDFNPDPYVDEFRTANGDFDTYLTKFDDNGSLVWVRSWGGEDSGIFEEPANIVSVDKFNNIYVIGSFAGTCDFDPGPDADEHASTDQNIFLTKFNSNGDHLWVRTWGSVGEHDIGFGVTTDEDGFVYATGTYRGTCDMDPGPGDDFHVSNGSIDVFISKFFDYGSFVWSKTFGGIGPDQSRGIDTDNFGNVYVGGCFEQDVDFKPGNGEDIKTSNGSADAYLTSYSPDGSYRWTRTVGGPDIDVSRGVCYRYLKVYLSGCFRETAEFDGGSPQTSAGERDGFVAVYDIDSNLVNTLLVSGPGIEQCASVCSDLGGGILITGPYSEGADLDPTGAGINIQSAVGQLDSYIIRLYGTHEFDWVATYGGEDIEFSWGIRTDNFGNIYTAGWFAGTPDFDPSDGVYPVASNGGIDAFLHMLPSSGTW